MMIRVVVLLLVPAFIFLAVEKGSNTMMMSKPRVDIDGSIPPVDTKVPARTETATFALG